MNHLFKKKLFFSLCLISVLSACGKEARWEATSPAGAENLISSAGGNAYRTSAAISYQTSSGNSALLPAGTNVTILETRKDPEVGDLVHLGVDSDDAKLPSEIWLKAKEIEAAGLEALQETDLNGDAEIGRAHV